MNDFQPTLTHFSQSNLGFELQSFAPQKKLAGLIHNYLMVSAKKDFPYMVMPSALQTVFIGPNQVIISASQEQSQCLFMQKGSTYFGIQFHAGAFKKLFNVDSSEGHNQLLSSDFLNKGLFEHILDSANSGSFKRFKTQCDKLFAPLSTNSGNDKVQHVISQIIKSQGLARVDELSTNVSISTRQLNRLMSLYTGSSTKAFCQKINLQHSVQQYFQCGDHQYYDQPQFIRAVKRCFNLTPTILKKTYMSDLYN